ncbi:MAG: ABC transporter permease subunit [Alphaproteobacteria bacterium]|nr:ABC transporter permease subunit [Alphaproteobacteria bacterium]
MTTTAAPPSPAAPARKRSFQTRRSVVVADMVADWGIRIGGIGVIVAVFGIMAFLAEVTVPLFAGGSVTAVRTVERPATQGRVLVDRVDEYKTLSVAVTDRGEVQAIHVDTGTPLRVANFDLEGRRATAFASTRAGDNIVFGLDDGSIRFAQLKIAVQVLPGGSIPAGASELPGSPDRTDGEAIYASIPGGQVRRLSVEARLEPAEKVADPGTPIVAADYHIAGTVERPTKTIATVDAKGIARLTLGETKINLMTGQPRTTVDSVELPPLPAGFRVATLLTTEAADQVYIADRGGMVARYDTRDFRKPVLAESVDLVAGEGELTALGFLIGDQSLVLGGSDGRVDIYFKLPRHGARSADGATLVRAHELERHTAPVVAIAPSQRSKLFATADATGNVFLRHGTSEQTVVKVRPASAAVRYSALALAPRDDGIVAMEEGTRVHAWGVHAPHPETTVKAIFGKIWYEGYPEPSYTWQSSSGTDSFEPKLSLVPLIFGTIKAAFYSLLFAVPVALGAAIYTSEFVHPAVRGVVKPTMEMMASLPSVVLGFIAALILAPVVETWIAAVLLAFVAVPLGLFVGAHLWQMLPTPVSIRYGNLPKFALIFLALAGSFVSCYYAGGAFEKALFGGDFKAWVNARSGSGAPFLFLLLWPLAFFAALHLFDRYLDPRHAQRLRSMPRVQAGLVDMTRWVAVLATSALLAYAAAALVDALGGDPRGALVDTYVQRNTLVVGFAMAFAVIPLIYTIAEDALNAVPEHLRGASLACGATPWQTATRVILPTAASGVFAAVMIGMGRAVGETMIVVMAAGNTPVLEWNIFSGLRALSANIAVELPEAVKDGTLYRMLFLAALVLFGMTFVINTLAEIVRLRFRKRSAQL